jgi:alpha-tubulin suppressor-like RCC1 family protein
MKIILSSSRHHYVAIVSIFLIITALIAGIVGCGEPKPLGHLYACEEDLIEIMFAPDSKVRLRDGAPVDLATNALAGVDDILQELEWFEWYRICDVSEEMLDEIQAHGEANTGEPVYNLNNIYRLRIPMGLDVWAISKELETLSGIIFARPVPKPVPLPQPPNYIPAQGYLRPASSTPAGINADYAWTQPGGNGSGVTVYDLEYEWNYNHTDITKAIGSQINPNAIPYTATASVNHGTAVIGELVSDNNGWGTTGICYGASLKTCGTYYYQYYFPYFPWGFPYSPSGSYLSWNVAGAIAYAIADALTNLSAADVILLEQQWDYTGSGGYVPVEWYGSSYVSIGWWGSLNYYYLFYQFQPNNPVYAAIVNAVSNGIHVVEAGGNGNVNTDNLIWYGDSGAIIVGAGNPLERLSFSSYGSRFDLQGWGHNVVTTGYGDLYNSAGVNLFYTSTFSGTSSASPIVAGAVAAVQGNRLARGLPTLSPAAMRSLLVATGSSQNLVVAGKIGPLPDLARALAQFGRIPMVAAGDIHTVGLSANGTVVAVGDNSYGQCNVSGWTNIIQVAAGGFHTVGLKSNGTVVAVGANSSGLCNVGGWTNITQVAAGTWHTVGVKSDGTVVAVGDNQFGQCNVSGWTNIIQVAAGGLHTVGLKSDGTVVAVGWNDYGQCNVGGWTSITEVAAGYGHTVGLKADGTVVAVGDNSYGQLNVGGWTGITQIAAGGHYYIGGHTVGLKANGTVVTVGDDTYGQCNVGGWTNITQVAAGYFHTVGLNAYGTVVAVGYNYFGQCNVGGWTLN